MKFSTRVKVVSLLAVFLLMLSGLPVVTAEAAQGITDPALNAFFHPDPKPGAAASLLTLAPKSGQDLGNYKVRVLGWKTVSDELGKRPDGDTKKFIIDGLTRLMNEAKKRGLSKVHLTTFEITSKGGNPIRDIIDWGKSTYTTNPGELFLHCNFEKLIEKWGDLDIYMNMDQAKGTMVGFMTFTPAAGIAPVSEEALADIQGEIQSKLGITTVVSATNPTVKTGTDVSTGNKAKTSSVISVSKSVAQGGGVVFGTVTMPVTDVSETGASLPTVSSFNELRSSYKVMKYFGGASVDLLEVFGDELFKFSNGTAEFKKPLVVIDDARPSKDIEGLKPYGGTYGLLLTDTCLVVYDGNKNGAAEDPIALEAKGGGGGGGCSAGFGIAGLLLAGLAVLKYRKK